MRNLYFRPKVIYKFLQACLLFRPYERQRVKRLTIVFGQARALKSKQAQ
jgi:hypothetical protein